MLLGEVTQRFHDGVLPLRHDLKVLINVNISAASSITARIATKLRPV